MFVDDEQENLGTLGMETQFQALRLCVKRPKRLGSAQSVKPCLFCSRVSQSFLVSFGREDMHNFHLIERKTLC